MSADFFATLGVDAWRGRVFVPEEERPGREHVLIVGHGLWKRRHACASLPGRRSPPRPLLLASRDGSGWRDELWSGRGTSY